MCMYIKSNGNIDLKLKYDSEYNIDLILDNRFCERKIFFIVINLIEANDDEIGPNNLKAIYYVILNKFPCIILVDLNNFKLFNLLNECKFMVGEISNTEDIYYLLYTKENFSQILKLNEDTIKFQNNINNFEHEIKSIGNFTERLNRRKECRDIIYKII
jgi:hypothetical protein